MKQQNKKFKLVSLGIAVALVGLLSAYIGYNAIPASQGSSSNDITDKSIIKAISELNISNGALRSVQERKDAYGNKQLVLEDNSYRYFIDTETNDVISGVLIESDKQYDGKPSLSEQEYLNLAKQFVNTAFKSFNKETAIYKASYDKDNLLEYATFVIEERAGTINR